MVRLIAVDMDDTVLNNKLEITGYTREVIKEAVRQGVYVTFATGRMFRSCRPFAAELDLDIPLITYNGALIKQAKSETVLYHQPVPLTVAREIAAWSGRTRHHLQIYVHDKLYVREINEKALLYGNRAQVEVIALGDLAGFLTEAPTKMLVITDQDHITEVERELRDTHGQTVHLTRSKPTFLEILHPAVSKGEALAYLAGMLGVPREEVMAIGDGYNDLEMLVYAGVSVAMGNAQPYIKARADFVTLTNEEDGAAKAIERVLQLPRGRAGP